MVATLIVLGVACLAGAAAGARARLLAARPRRLLLAVAGVVLLLGSGYFRKQGSAAPPPPSPDPVAGVWKSADGTAMELRRTGDRYDVTLTKANGYTDIGKGSIEGNKVVLSFKNKFVGSYTAELTVAGNQMTGNYLAAGMRIPAVLKR